MTTPWWLGRTDVVVARQAHSDLLVMNGAIEGLDSPGDGLDGALFVEAVRSGRIPAFAADPETPDLVFPVDRELAARLVEAIDDEERFESVLLEAWTILGPDVEERPEADDEHVISDLLAGGSLFLGREGLVDVTREAFGLSSKGGRPPDPDKALYVQKYFDGEFESKADADRWLLSRRKARGEGARHDGIPRLTRRWIAKAGEV